MTPKLSDLCEYHLMRNGQFVSARLLDPAEVPEKGLAPPDLGERVREWLATHGVAPGAVLRATPDVVIVMPSWSADTYQIVKAGASWLPYEAWSSASREGLPQ